MAVNPKPGGRKPSLQDKALKRKRGQETPIAAGKYSKKVKRDAPLVPGNAGGS